MVSRILLCAAILFLAGSPALYFRHAPITALALLAGALVCGALYWKLRDTDDFTRCEQDLEYLTATEDDDD
jgi:hypothetical protein